MKRKRGRTGLGGISAGLVLAASAVSLTLPSSGLALGGFNGENVSLAARGSFASFTPASVDPALARLLTDRHSTARLMRFTPAGAANRPDRSVTVAVRVDAETARAISVRSAITAAQGEAGRGPGAIVLAPMRYNLGVARGYRSFAQPASLPEIQRIDMPDLASFAPKAEQAQPGRFTARIAVEDKGNLVRPLDGTAQKSVDVAGSYRVLRNLDLTAGLRYSQGRDRLDPLTDGRQDSQAVYVGTQFRF